jgi:hypothetical protein
MNQATTSECNESYCVISLVHRLPHTDDSVKGELNLTKVYSKIYIPSSDATTLADVTAVINALTAKGFGGIAPVSCGVDQDQVQGGYRVTGRII